jgi:DNA transformation protein
MFGGYGLYCGAHFFAIVYDGRLYFKINSDTLAEYIAYKSLVFAPSEKQILKKYREVPINILEDREYLLHWARKAAGK